MKKKSIFYKAFIALTLVAAIPTIITTIILSYQVMQYSEDEISRSAIGNLKVASNFTKTIAQKLYMDALMLNVNGTVDDMSDINKYDDIFINTDHIMTVNKLQKALMNLDRANDILQSVYLLPENSDFILSTNQGIRKLSDFYDIGWMNDYENFKKFKSDSTWLPTRTLSLKDVNNIQGAPYNVITFFYNLNSYTTTVSGTLIFNIHEEALCNLINDNSSISEGHIIIINSTGDVISHIKSETVGQKLNENYTREITSSKKREGYIINKNGAERQLVTYYKSDFNNWIYIGVFPLDILLDKVNSLMLRTFFVCFVCLVLGTFVSYIVSKKLSSPLGKLVQDIKVRKGIDIKSNDSEMNILSSAFDYMIKEEERMFSILESNRDNNRNAYLMNLLQGKSSEQWSFDFTGIDFDQSDYICAVIGIDKYKEFTNVYSKEQQDYMRTLILKVTEQLIGSTYKCVGIVYEKQKIVLIINLAPCPPGVAEPCIKDTFLKVQEELSKVLDNSISVGIGSIQDSLTGVSESFDKAQEALKCKLINGYGSINFWKEINSENSTYFYSYSIEKQIFSIINSGSKEKLEEAISELIREIRDKADIQYENVVQIFNQLAVNTVKFLFDLHLNISMIFGSDYNIYHDLSKKETMEDIKQWLVDTYSAISDYLAVSRCQNKSYFDRVLDYITENYKKDIDISVIADNVGLSYSHLRKIFKDETGDNIINYINNMRINESKRLLCQTNLPIREIALNLGYNNEQSFIRFFKKYESSSPGEFRISGKNLQQDLIMSEPKNTQMHWTDKTG